MSSENKDTTYYNRYWDKNIVGGVMNLPPSWSPENLEWHNQFFKSYLGANVLDVGAGEGTFLNYIKSKNSCVTKAVASELSSVAVTVGKGKYPSLEFRNDKLESLSFEDSSFDTVFAIEVVEHLLDIDLCLSEVHRVLKTGGYFCVTTTDFNLPKQLVIAGLFWEKFFYPNNPHIRFFTKKTLKEICSQHGMSQVDYKWNHSYFSLMPQGQMAVFKKI